MKIDLRTEDTELVFNLWAFADKDTGYVYSVSGRAYRLAGDEASKLATLKSLAFTDFNTARRLRLSDRFKVADGNETMERLAPPAFVNDPVAQFFEEVFIELEKELPPILHMHDGEITGIKQTIPTDPLSVRTIIYEDSEGNFQTTVVPDATLPDGGIESLDEDEVETFQTDDQLDAFGLIIRLLRAALPRLEAAEIRKIAPCLLALERLPRTTRNLTFNLTIGNTYKPGPDGGITNAWADIDMEEGNFRLGAGFHVYDPAVGGDTESRTVFECSTGGYPEGDPSEWISRATELLNEGAMIKIESEDLDDELPWYGDDENDRVSR